VGACGCAEVRNSSGLEVETAIVDEAYVSVRKWEGKCEFHNVGVMLALECWGRYLRYLQGCVEEVQGRSEVDESGTLELWEASRGEFKNWEANSGGVLES
jgi:hypothetical protein